MTKRDPYGYSDADYERAQAAMAAAVSGSGGLRNSPYLDRPLRTPDQVLAARTQRRVKLSPYMAAALARVAERGQSSCDMDDREQGISAAISLSKLEIEQPEAGKGTGMDINQIYQSKHLKGEELLGRGDVTLKIGNVSVEEFDEGPKIVLGFHGTERTLVLNRTNARMIGEMYGTETNGWLDRPVTIHHDKVDFKGTIRDTIRVRFIAQQPAAPAPATNGPLPDPGATLPAGVQPASQLPGADHPFAPSQPDQSNRPVGGMAAAIGDGLPGDDDPIPFAPSRI